MWFRVHPARLNRGKSIERRDERPVLTALACSILTLRWTKLLLLDVWTVSLHDVGDEQTSVKRAVKDVIRQIVGGDVVSCAPHAVSCWY